MDFLDLKANKFSNNDNLNKYNSVLKSDSYEEYMEIANFATVEKLRDHNKKLQQRIEDAKSKKEKLTKETEKSLAENTALENSLNDELNQLEKENKILVDKNNQLRDEYWENRNEYDYILGSKSWQYTKWLRRD